MAIIPSKKVEQLQFFESHWPIWDSAPTTIGLTAAKVSAFKTLTMSARTDFDAAIAARNASRAATTTQDVALSLAYESCADLIGDIKAFAAAQPNPNTVYGLAQIPPPAIPQPAPPPGQPTNITVTLENTGAITLRWKAVNSAPNAGTYFDIRRKLNNAGAFTIVGNTGGKIFTDDTLPQGTANATYIVQGHRGTESGPGSDQINVQFGVSGDGFTIASVQNVKLAA